MKTLALSIIFTLALGISQAATWPNPFTTNSGTALLYQGSADSTETNSGLMSSNAWVQSEWMPNQGEGAFRTPPLGIAQWYGSFDGTSWTNHASVVGISNALYSANLALYPYGYRYLQLDDGWSQTSLDANNLAQMSPSMAVTFGSGTAGVQAFINAVHTNGWKIALYSDGGTNLSTSGLQHGLGGYLLWTNLATLCRYGMDGIKSDQNSYDKQRIAAIIGQNGYSVFFDGGSTNGNVMLPSIFETFMNGVRPITGGDIVSYPVLMNWCDVVQTNNWWQYVRPGHFVDMDYVGGEAHGGGGLVATKTHVIVDALFSSPIWDDAFIGGSADMLFTNRNLLAINQDAAVICAQRCIQTNGCDVYVKPLGSANGPQFAVGILNRSTNTPASVTLYWTNLWPLFVTGSAAWSAFDCVSNTGWVLQNTNSFSVTLAAYDSFLWRLQPGSAMQTNYIQPASYTATLPASVISNGVPLGVFNVPWDTDATNFIARAQLTNDTVQCFRIQFYFTKLKDAGFWTRFDAFYPITPGSPYLNAISSSYTLSPQGAVTTNALGIAGNGTSSYFTNGYIFSVNGVNYTRNSASLGFYSGSQSPTAGGMFGGAGDAAEAAYVQAANANTFAGKINDQTGLSATRSDFRGLFAMSRISSSSELAFMNGTAVTANDASVGVPTFPFLLSAFYNNTLSPNFFSNVRIQVAWIGGGFSGSELATLKQICDEGEAILGRKSP